MTMHFAHPSVLYLLWLAPVLALGAYSLNRRREQRLADFVSPVMQAKLRPKDSPFRFNAQLALLAAGLLLALLAAARPRWGMREEVVLQRSRDLLIALDVSRSMLAADVHPNRLERAKADILDLIKELPGDRVALLAFRRTAVLLCPLTTDYAYFRQALDAMSIDSAPRGETNIGDAIDKAVQAFESDPGSHKAVILISDGEDLSGTALAAAERAGQKRIPIFTVGLGSRTGTTIPEGDGAVARLRSKGTEVITRLDHDGLYAIANLTGGAYIPVETAGMASTTLGTLYRDYLRNLSAREMEETLQRRHIERYMWFLLPAFLCFLAAASLSRGRLAVRRGAPPIPAAATLALLAVASLLLPASGFAAAPSASPSNAVPAVATNAMEVPAGMDGARIAQDLYRSGRFTESAQAYLQAARTAGPAATETCRFNAAAAWFKAGEYTNAADVLRDLALTESAAKAEIHLALATTLYRAAAAAKDGSAATAETRAKQIREASEAFREAWRADPNSELARRNLAVTLANWPRAAEESTRLRLMERYGSQSAGQIAGEMLRTQRELLKQTEAAFTNDRPDRIRQLEDIARRQEQNADLWIPLKGKIMEAIAAQPGDTNLQQQAATLDPAIEATRAGMKGAAKSLRDLEPEGYDAAFASEMSLYRFWKAVAPHDLLLQEDIRLQSNSVQAIAAGAVTDARQRPTLAAIENEARALTDLFLDRFAAAVPEEGLPTEPAPTADGATTATNAPAITAETRAKILDLGQQASGLQSNAVAAIHAQRTGVAGTHARESHRLLKEIEALLPKQPNSSSSQQQQEQENPQEEQNPSEKQEKSPQESDPQSPPPQPDEPQPAEENKEQTGEDKKPEDMSEQELQRLLDKALQREKEHEAEKRKMNRQFMPPSPIERDW